MHCDKMQLFIHIFVGNNTLLYNYEFTNLENYISFSLFYILFNTASSVNYLLYKFQKLLYKNN